MKLKQIRNNFIDRTAKKPEGKWAVKNYSNPRAHYRSFRIIMKDLDPGGKDVYCEIGCGGGVLLNMVLQKVRQAAAIDHSEEMVSLSLEKNEEYVNSGVLEVVQGNAEKLPWQNSSFTICGSANMFFFVDNPADMLSEVFRVLKPGGRFSLVTMGKGFLSKISFGWLYGLNTYSDQEMRSMLFAAGFSNIRVKTGLSSIQTCYAEKL